MRTLILGCLIYLLPGSPPLSGQSLTDLPLFEMEDLNYRGAFRIRAQTYNGTTINYSEGPIAYNPDNHSIFIVGHAHEQAIAEYPVPEVVNSTVLADLSFSEEPLQAFEQVLDLTPDGNPEGIDRVGGLFYVSEGKGARLVVNAYEYYDAPGDNTVSTLVVDDATDLATTTTTGYLAFEGGSGHTSGWLSPIPKALQASLGGSHLTGQSSGIPIISRTSVGPSAFAFELDSLLAADRSVPTTTLLDFSLRNRLHPDLKNESLDNDLWTHLSRVTYGFIVPGTRTYLTVGKSGGHASGVCYKCTQDDGRRCGGYCSPEAADNDHYYWLWDLADLLAVKEGAKLAYDVRPYDHGVFDTPFESPFIGIGGGSFDPVSGDLYLTLQKADTAQGRYARPPVVVVYNVEQTVSTASQPAGDAIRAFPNPAAGSVRLTNLPAGSKTWLVNALGSTIHQFTVGLNTADVDLSDLPPGVYTLMVQDERARKLRTLRLVKQR